MKDGRLSLGARQLLTFLRGKAGAKGYCWWKQSTIAEHMDRGLRTVNRQIAELVDAKYLESEPHGHGNHYKLCDLSEKMAYQQPAVQNPAEITPVGVAATPNWRSGPSPDSITETEEPEEKLAEHSASLPRSEKREDKTNPSVSADFIDFIRAQTRFSIRGKMADEGTVRRLAGLLVDELGFRAWQVRCLEWRRENIANGWGILVELARDVAAERAQSGERFGDGRALRDALHNPEEPSDATDSLYSPEVTAERAQRAEYIAMATRNGFIRFEPDSTCECCGFGFRSEPFGEVCDCKAGRILSRRLESCRHCGNTGLIADPENPAFAAWCLCRHASERREREPGIVEEMNRERTELLQAQSASPNPKKAVA